MFIFQLHVLRGIPQKAIIIIMMIIIITIIIIIIIIIITFIVRIFHFVYVHMRMTI